VLSDVHFVATHDHKVFQVVHQLHLPVRPFNRDEGITISQHWQPAMSCAAVTTSSTQAMDNQSRMEQPMLFSMRNSISTPNSVFKHILICSWTFGSNGFDEKLIG